MSMKCGYWECFILKKEIKYEDNTNIQAINAYRHQYQGGSKNIEKLSGLRIIRVKDDAAELVISEKMRSQIRGLKW